jgi:hypothetical protein
MAKITDLQNAIRSRYQSLEKPYFGWVTDAYYENRTQSMREKLGEKFELVEFTDLNSDVSVGYELYERASMTLKWALRISLVGPYAVLIRNTPDEPDSMLVNGRADCQDASEACVATILSEGGVELLDRQTLSVPVPLILSAAQPGRVRMYQALFTDTDFMPGEFEAMTIGRETSTS